MCYKGTFNSMSYLEPISKWARRFSFLFRTQNKTYVEQYDIYGVRLFDLHIRFNDKNHAVFCIGKKELHTFSFYEVLNYFQKKGDCVIRIVLDLSRNELYHQGLINQKKRFYEFCNIVEQLYPDMQLCGGQCLADNDQIHLFKWEHLNGVVKIAEDFLPAEQTRYKKFLKNIVRICMLVYIIKR